MPARTIAEAFEQARSLDAPLAERLDTYAQTLREINRPMAEAVERLVTRLKQSRLAEKAPVVGEPMPPFLLPNHLGRLVGLEELLEEGPLAITFARGHWCPYCRIAVSALAEIAEDAEAIGARIVVIVPDRQEYAAKLRAETQAPFPILTDIDNGYALSLGMVFWVGEEMQHHMRAREVDLATSQGNDSWFVPVPATFVLGRDAKIVARHVDPDYRKRMEVEAVLAALRKVSHALDKRVSP
jgi:peroxiredoxin